MSDIPVAVSVLNGEVQVGDKIVYAAKDGDCAGIRIARVLEIYGRVDSWTGRTRPVLKVQIIKASRSRMSGHKTSVAELDRVVKL